MRISAAQRVQNENRIRAAKDRDRATARRDPTRRELRYYHPRLRGRRRPHRLLRHRPYAHLRTEFEHRLRQLQRTVQTPDPKATQIERLKAEIDKLRNRLAQANSTIEELANFRTQALARLAAQHEEIQRLRTAVDPNANVTRLPPGAAEGHWPMLTLHAYL